MDLTKKIGNLTKKKVDLGTKRIRNVLEKKEGKEHGVLYCRLTILWSKYLKIYKYALTKQTL